MHKQIHMTLMMISGSVFRSRSMLESHSNAPRVPPYAAPCSHCPRYFAFLLDLSARLRLVPLPH